MNGTCDDQKVKNAVHARSKHGYRCNNTYQETDLQNEAISDESKRKEGRQANHRLNKQRDRNSKKVERARDRQMIREREGA